MEIYSTGRGRGNPPISRMLVGFRYQLSIAQNALRIFEQHVAVMLPSLLRILAKRAKHFASECLDICQSRRNCGCLCLNWIYQEEFIQGVLHPMEIWWNMEVTHVISITKVEKICCGWFAWHWEMASSSRRFDLGLGICKTTGAKNSHSDRRRHEFFALWGGVEVDFRVCTFFFLKMP